VHDLDSTNGIRLAGEKIQDATWTPGQILEVGDIRIELERAAAPLVAPALATATLATPTLAAPVLATPAEAASPHRSEFGEVMFAELKRAPWFLLSILVHAVLLLLAWFLFEKEVPTGPDPRHFSVEQQELHDAVAEDKAIESLPDV